MAVSAPLQSLDLGFTENKSIGVQLDQNVTISAVFTTHSSLSVGEKKKKMPTCTRTLFCAFKNTITRILKLSSYVNVKYMRERAYLKLT